MPQVASSLSDLDLRAPMQAFMPETGVVCFHDRGVCMCILLIWSHRVLRVNTD